MLTLRRHTALVALVAAGLLWGLTVPLSKLVLDWLDGGTLTVVRFALAAPLLAFFARKHLKAAFTPRILAAGAIGYGLVIVLQNAGIERTSVSHAALIVGATPALVALVSVATGRGKCGPLAWAGFALALAGVGIVAGGGGGAATLGGDAIVLLSVSISACFVVVQPSLLAGRDPFAVTAVQMIGGLVAALPNALAEGLPHAPASATPVLALALLAFAGTVGPFALFAYGQSRVAPELAGRVPEPRAAGRHRRGRARVRRPVRADAAARRRGDPRRHRALDDPAQGASRGGAEGDRTARCGSPHPHTPGTSLPARTTNRDYARIKQHPLNTLPNMTLLAPRPDRSLTPHTFAVPVVRELPSSETLKAAGVSPSSLW